MVSNILKLEELDERSLEKLRFGSERVVTGVTREKSRLMGKLRMRAERGNGFQVVIIRKS